MPARYTTASCRSRRDQSTSAAGCAREDAEPRRARPPCPRSSSAVAEVDLAHPRRGCQKSLKRRTLHPTNRSLPANISGNEGSRHLNNHPRRPPRPGTAGRVRHRWTANAHSPIVSPNRRRDDPKSTGLAQEGRQDRSARAEAAELAVVMTEPPQAARSSTRRLLEADLAERPDWRCAPSHDRSPPVATPPRNQLACSSIHAGTSVTLNFTCMPSLMPNGPFPTAPVLDRRARLAEVLGDGPMQQWLQAPLDDGVSMPSKYMEGPHRAMTSQDNRGPLLGGRP